ncbi:MAG: FAD-binding oxidoreductase [Oscillospiraceae bacterium]
MTADVIVIGGGVIGSAITYYLSKRGKRVVQIEREYYAAGASGACDQMVIPQSKAPNEHLTLALYSEQLYRQLAEELKTDIEYVPKGSMVLIENRQELQIMEEVTAKQRALGMDVTIVDTKDAMKLQRGLNPEAIIASTYCPQGGEVNPFRMNLAFSDAAVRLGAVVKLYAPVTEVLLQNGAVAGVKTPAETISAPIVVDAAGAWAPQIGEMVGLNLPIKPRRGQIFITEAVAPFVDKCVLNARYIVAKHHPEMLKNDTSELARLGVGISLTQSHKGNILIGSTREFVGFDTANTYEGLGELMKNALHLLPGLADKNIIRTMGGVRPYPPDSKPLIGFVGRVPGFFVAAGHEGDGICLAPATGRLVADLIADGKTQVPAAASFDPNRFEL